MSKIKQVQQIIERILKQEARSSLAHQWDHIKRVCNNSLQIAESYGDSVDLEILQLAALLHDIGQTYDNKKEHQEISAVKASQVLEQVGYSSEVIEKVSKIIREHSSENNLDKLRPSSFESKILFDADKIDGLGAVGITRALILCGQQGKSPKECIDWYQSKVEKTIPFIQTEEGRKLLMGRLTFVENFLKKYREEAEQLL